MADDLAKDGWLELVGVAIGVPTEPVGSRVVRARYIDCLPRDVILLERCFVAYGFVDRPLCGRLAPRPYWTEGFASDSKMAVRGKRGRRFSTTRVKISLRWR